MGVRQPTLYSHFDSKHAILAALLDADLLPARGRVRAALDLEGPVAAKLHALLVADVAAILSLPYDVRGFYNDDVLQMPELRVQSELRAELHALTAGLISKGIDSGELLEVEPEFVRRAITGLMLQSVSERGAEPAPDATLAARQIADFVVRAVLADPAGLPQVQTASADLVELIAGGTT